MRYKGEMADGVTRLQQTIAEHSHDEEGLVEALVSFDFEPPDPGPSYGDVPDAVWYRAVLDRSPAPNTLDELEALVHAGRLSRGVFNRVLDQLRSGG